MAATWRLVGGRRVRPVTPSLPMVPVVAVTGGSGFVAGFSVGVVTGREKEQRFFLFLKFNLIHSFYLIQGLGLVHLTISLILPQALISHESLLCIYIYIRDSSEMREGRESATMARGVGWRQ